MEMRKTRLLFISIALVMLFIINAIPFETYGQDNLRVRNLDTGEKYEKIQEAINAASVGNTIYVKNGTYYENVVVNKTISLVGENKSNTIIDGRGSRTVISVTADNVNIKGFTIRNSEWTFPYSAVYVYYANGHKISDNIIKNSLYGIHLYYSGESTVVNNTILDNRYGLSLTSATDNVVSNNNFSRNDDGIQLSFSRYNTFSGNNISLSKFNGVILSTSTNNVFVNNTILNNGYGYGFHSTFCGYSTFSGNNISRNEQGFSLSGCSYNIISGNYISYNTGCGVWLGASSDNVFANNYVVDNGESFHSETSEGNTIYHNNFINTQVDTTQQPSCFDSANSWDNSIEGNYWNSQTRTDENRDGIADEAYTIDEKNIDNYPLMAIFSQFNIIVNSRVYAIDVVSNSTISRFEYFHFPANRTAVLTFHINNTGEKQFCRVSVPNTLVEPPHAVVLNNNVSLQSRIVHSNATHSWLYFTYYCPENGTLIIAISSQELPAWYQLWFWTIVGLTLIIAVLLLLVIRYHRMYGEQRRIIEAYELKIHAREHLNTARAFFESDVERRRAKIDEFEKKYKVRIRPRNDLDDMIRNMEFKRKGREKLED